MIAITNVQKLLGSVIPGFCCIVLNVNLRKRRESPLKMWMTIPRRNKKGKRKRSNEIARNANKKTKTESISPSGIFVRYASEFKETTKEKRKYDVKKECIDEVASVEAMKEVEKKLWLEHYDQLCEKLLEVVREKCTGCQTDEAN